MPSVVHVYLNVNIAQFQILTTILLTMNLLGQGKFGVLVDTYLSPLCECITVPVIQGLPGRHLCVHDPTCNQI